MFRKLGLIAVPIALAAGLAFSIRGLARSTPPATAQSTHHLPGRTSSATSPPRFRAPKQWVSKYWWIPPGFQLLNELLAHRSYPSMAWP